MLVPVLALGAVALLSGASTAHGSSSPPFQTGYYVGSAAQHQTIKFKIVKRKCDAPTRPFKLHSAYCFGVVSSARLDEFCPTMLEPCTPDTTYRDPLYVASYQLSLSKTGHLSWTIRARAGATASHSAPRT
jgi:hypothetical protein